MRPLSESERLRVLEREGERGETERRGDRDRDRFGERAATGGERVRPREEDLEDMSAKR